MILRLSKTILWYSKTFSYQIDSRLMKNKDYQKRSVKPMWRLAIDLLILTSITRLNFLEDLSLYQTFQSSRRPGILISAFPVQFQPGSFLERIQNLKVSIVIFRTELLSCSWNVCSVRLAWWSESAGFCMRIVTHHLFIVILRVLLSFLLIFLLSSAQLRGWVIIHQQ